MMTEQAQAKAETEEFANSLSHGVGLVAAVVATCVLIPSALQAGRPGYLIGSAVFAATMILVYLASTLYHGLPAGRLKDFFLQIDHTAIYLFIAGTYTPFTLGVLRHANGPLLCAVVWTLAILGIVLQLSDRMNHPFGSTALYLAMGWTILLSGRSTVANLSSTGLTLLVAGGLAYTIGVIFYAIGQRVRYGHLVWHLFVMAGSTLHFFAVLWHGA
jgi:hemolysin III